MSYFSFAYHERSHKCAVIGCVGIGAAVARMLSQSKQVDALVLLDPDKRASEGLAADLCCALPLDVRTDIWSGDYSDLAGCSLIVLALGNVCLYENAHADLVALNLPLIRKAAADIMENYQDAVILVLGQPCEIMTRAFLQYTGLAKSKVIGTGTLAQTLHLRRLLGKYLGVHPSQIHAFVLGGADTHGIFCLDSVRVCGVRLDEYLSATGRGYDTAMPQSLFEDAVHAFVRAAEIRGMAVNATASACLMIAENILSDSNDVLPLCVSTQGFADLGQVCLSLPCLTGRDGVRPLSEALLSLSELDALRRAAARLRAQMPDVEQSFPAT